MKTYETTFIINPQVDDATIDRQVKAVLDIITGNGGTILRQNRMGTRRLAYEIKGLTQGYYADVVFEGSPEVLSLLTRHYRLEEPYVRYLTILFEGSLTEEGERPETAGATERESRRPAEPEVTAKPVEKLEPVAEASTTESPAEEAVTGEEAPVEEPSEKPLTPEDQAEAEPAPEPEPVAKPVEEEEEEL
ncbi:MAG TPA: 30S ribosomal protein S6 [Acidobacteriota bacterium]|nr:30S ribosomal protein S6 [Acidobacteriota bacterium]